MVNCRVEGETGGKASGPPVFGYIVVGSPGSASADCEDALRCGLTLPVATDVAAPGMPLGGAWLWRTSCAVEPSLLEVAKGVIEAATRPSSAPTTAAPGRAKRQVPLGFFSDSTTSFAGTKAKPRVRAVRRGSPALWRRFLWTIRPGNGLFPLLYKGSHIQHQPTRATTSAGDADKMVMPPAGNDSLLVIPTPAIDGRMHGLERVNAAPYATIGIEPQDRTSTHIVLQSFLYSRIASGLG